jgi:hypothetical protein
MGDIGKNRIKSKGYVDFHHPTYESLRIKEIILGVFDKERIINLLNAASTYNSYKNDEGNTVIQTEYIKYILVN